MTYKIEIKLLLVSIALSCFSNVATAQEKVVAPSKSLEKVADQEAKPTFDYNQYIANNFKYPQEAMEAGIEGRVLVKFVVQIDGTITDAKVTRGQELGHGIPEEAVRVVSNMPKWTPAYADGKPVKSNFTVPLTLKMADEVQEEIVNDIAETEAIPGYDWQSYVNKNLRYPKGARLNGTIGRVMVKFTVTESGKIEDIGITEGENIKDGLPKEAIRIVTNMPKWIPGTIGGKAVKSSRTIPITFNSQTESANKESPALELFSSGDFDTIMVENTMNKKARPDYDLQKYLSENLRYPKRASNEGVQGRIMVKFVINTKGEIENPKIIRGNELGYGLPEEAIRVVSNMPKWVPAEYEGNLVKSYFTMPINFRFE